MYFLRFIRLTDHYEAELVAFLLALSRKSTIHVIDNLIGILMVTGILSNQIIVVVSWVYEYI